MKQTIIMSILCNIIAIVIIGIVMGADMTHRPNIRVKQCSRFTIVEVIVPIVPISCLLSIDIYP